MFQKEVVLPNAETLLVEWEEDLSGMNVSKDGTFVGRFYSKDEIKQGRSFRLSDGQEITVIYTEFGLEVWQNGKELVSNATSGSVEAFGHAVKWLKWIGIAQLVLMPIRYFMRPEEDRILEAIASLVVGGLLVGLGFWAQKTGNKTPFWIGIGFGVLNIALTLLAGSFGGILIMGILIYNLYKGIQAEAPRIERKAFTDPNAPLDSDL